SSGPFDQTSDALGGLTGEAAWRNRVVARTAPRPAAAQPMGGEPAAAQRAMARHRLGRIGRAVRLIAAGADKEIGQRELIEADCPTQSPNHKAGEHAARKLAIRRAGRKESEAGHGVAMGVATASARSRFRASRSSCRRAAKSRPMAAWRPTRT